MPDFIHLAGGAVEGSLRRRRLRRMPPWSYCSVGVKLREMRAESKEVRGPEVRRAVAGEGGRAVGAGWGVS
jgi:hypothetical protein